MENNDVDDSETRLPRTLNTLEEVVGGCITSITKCHVVSLLTYKNHQVASHNSFIRQEDANYYRV